MRDNFTSDLHPSYSRVRYRGEIETDHAISLKHVKSVAECTNHRAVADSRHILEPRYRRHGGMNHRPVVVPEIPLHGESKHLALLIRLCLRQSETLNDPL